MKSDRTDLATEEFLPAAELDRLRNRRWRTQREYVLNRSSFFKRLWTQSHVPHRLEEFANLPLCCKSLLRESQIACPPFGDYLAADPDSIVRLHRTSGTTGQAMNAALTELDALQTARIGARCFRAAGLKPADMVIHCLNYQMWMGGVTDHLSLEAAGATVIPFGVGDSRHLIRTIADLDVAAIHSTPSYPAVLEQTISDHFENLTPRDLGLRIGLFGGEAGLDSEAFRNRLEETWGYAVRNSNYGMADAFSNFAGQCEHSNDLHLLGHDVLFAELICPQSLSVIPFETGETGELVLTHLMRQAQPLVRFRTNDMVTITGTDTCRCGRTTPRFRVLGRSDDMIIVRGVNVYPTAVRGVINSIPELSGEFRIRLRGKGPYDRLRVEAELAAQTTATADLAETIEHKIRQTVRASAQVELFPARSFPRTEGKTKRVIRE
ncbi:MAG: hypothetical protein OXI60_12300 [Acidiferrobacterales bacterium]|nr:hypothetical protein [Acidiferrobacterales bacterium]